MGTSLCHLCTVSLELNMSAHCSDPVPTACWPIVSIAKVLSRPISLWCFNLIVRETCSTNWYGNSKIKVLLKTGLISCFTTPVRSFFITLPKWVRVTDTKGWSKENKTYLYCLSLTCFSFSLTFRKLFPLYLSSLNQNFQAFYSKFVTYSEICCS